MRPYGETNVTTVFHVALGQPSHVLDLSSDAYDALIISMRKVDGIWVVASRYGDDVWWPTGATTNVRKYSTKLDFQTIPDPLRPTAKAMMYRFLRRGKGQQKVPGASNLVKVLSNISYFLRYVHSLGICKVSEITTMVCATYVQYCKAHAPNLGVAKKETPESKRTLSSSTLWHRFHAVETVYELSQYSGDSMPRHPWPDASAQHIAGGTGAGRDIGKKTPLIPDQVFSKLFESAWEILQNADHLLDLRDEMEVVSAVSKQFSTFTVNSKKNQALEKLGWQDGHKKLNADILNIRTACYIVIASLSGCRNHELAFVRGGKAYYSTLGADEERYWWMRSKSTKTDEGDTQWMIPEAAVLAIKIMERWAAPLQASLVREIEEYRAVNPVDLRIAEAEEHLGALFVGIDKRKGNLVRTLAVNRWNVTLKAFSVSCGLMWDLTSHQFRRKFANYAARSQFGDLRYLKEHFKHWSLDMTLGYAMNESQEMALYLEIEEELDDIKEDVVNHWFNDSEPLTGGYGKNIMNWRCRNENVILFKNHAQMIRSIAQSTSIRSNGHAWCTADDNLCMGNDLERTRCGNGCENAVIGRQHSHIYQGLYDQLKSLMDCKDIGEGGMTRVQRDLDRCAIVLRSLGYEPKRTVP